MPFDNKWPVLLIMSSWMAVYGTLWPREQMFICLCQSGWGGLAHAGWGSRGVGCLYKDIFIIRVLKEFFLIYLTGDKVHLHFVPYQMFQGFFFFFYIEYWKYLTWFFALCTFRYAAEKHAKSDTSSQHAVDAKCDKYCSSYQSHKFLFISIFTIVPTQQSELWLFKRPFQASVCK